MKKNYEIPDYYDFDFLKFIRMISEKRDQFRGLKIEDSVYLFNEDEEGEMTFLNFYDAIQKYDFDRKAIEERYFGIEKKSGYTDAEIIEINKITAEYSQFHRFQMDLNRYVNMMRADFVEDYKAFLNTLCTVRTYAKFKNVTEVTVRTWIRAGKLELIYLDETMFIVVPEEEFIDFNLFLLRRKVKKYGGFGENGEELWEEYDEKCEKKKEKIIQDGLILTEYGNNLGLLLRIHQAVSGEKVKVETKNSVQLWFEYREVSPTPYGKNPKSRFKIRTEWEEYCAWCKKERTDPVTIAVFSKWIGRLGFKKFIIGYRGFYGWTTRDFKN